MLAIRKSGAGRQARRRVLGTIALLALSLAVAMSCVITARQDSITRTEATVDDRQEDSCTSQPTREMCLSIQVDDELWRYTLYRAPTETAKTVLFDPGGPGAAALSGHYTLAEQPAMLGFAEYNLLVLEEPWVTAEVEDDCEASVTEYYRAARNFSYSDDVAAAVLTDCDFDTNRYGFEQDSYQRLVRAIMDKHALHIEGFVGHSFGSVRLAYLNADETLVPNWAVITRPFPVGISRSDLLAARAAKLSELFPTELHWIEETDLPDRSIPIDRFDQLSAAIGSGYADDQSMNSVTESIRTGNDLEMMGKLSDQLWMRYGVDSLSYGMLAYWQELCSAAGQSPGVDLDTDLNDLGLMLDTQTGPCNGGDPIAPVWSDQLRLCVTTSDSDTIAPSELVAEAFAGYPIESVEPRSHGDISGLERCLSSVR